MSVRSENPHHAAGLELLGSILQELRQQAKLRTSDIAARLNIKEAMVRMIESGSAALRAEHAMEYTALLNQETDGPLRPPIDPIALAEAYVALRVFTSKPYVGSSSRHQWLQYLGHDEEKARRSLKEELYAHSAAAQLGTGTPLQLRGLEQLNPIQLRLVENLASGIRALGSDVLTDDSIAQWELSNVDQLDSVHALVTSIESELASNSDFQKTIVKTLEHGQFRVYRYIIASDLKQFPEVRKAWTELESQILDRLRTSALRENAKLPWLRAHLERRMVTIEQYRRAVQASGSKSGSGSGWDGLYLYRLKSGRNLLIGIFRRLPSGASHVPPVGPASWGAKIMNESLPWHQIQSFEKLHHTLWLHAKS